MPFNIVRQDITRMKVDAIVNSANTALKMGGGVCGAIFKVAGASDLQAACDRLAPIQTGDAVITPGFMLPAKYVVHTAGPVYHGGKCGEEEQLRSCYLNSMKRAVENKCDSIAFPLISSGIYGYPKDEALRIATASIQDFLEEHDLEVFLAVFDKAAFTISKQLIGEVESYIDEHYVDNHWDRWRERKLLDVEIDALKAPAPIKALAEVSAPFASINDLVGNLDEPFSTTLLRLIDAKGKTDVEIYKRANIDRKLFSKIRTGKGYAPSKRTAIALAIAMELSLDETNDLLTRAGYTLSHSQKFDVIVEYFIVSGKFDIFEINEVLFKYDQQLLGG
ncbi:MAG: macro domain-containing protein [Anaerolineaceae bacterium]|nr:macro domain-containing protein [Anaerolineaceae bacterium]